MQTALVSAVLAAAVLLCGPAPARACHAASQIQLYPVGTVKGALIALLLHKQFGGNGKRTLTVTASLVRVRGKAKPKRLAKLGSYKLSPRSTRKTLRPVLNKAHKRARRLKGFRRLRMTRWTTCTSRTRCDGAQAITVAKSLAVRLGKKTKRAAWSLSTLHPGPAQYDIASVRRFRSGKSRWAVIDLRAGNNQCIYHARTPSTSKCRDKKQRRQIADGKKLTLRADSEPFHHGHDIAVAIRLR
jgi:hypothetical protein